MIQTDIIKHLEIAIYAAMHGGAEILSIYTSNTTSFEIETKDDNSPLTIADKNANAAIVKTLLHTAIPIISEEIKNEPYSIRKNWEYAWIVDPLDGTKEFIKQNGEFTVNIALVHKNCPIAGVIYTPVSDILYFGLSNEGSYKLNQASVAIEAFNFETLVKQSCRLPMARTQAAYTVVGSRSHMSEETTNFIDTLKKTHNSIDLISIGSSLKLCLIAEGKADIYPRFAPTSEWDIAAGHAIILGAGGRVYNTIDKSELQYNKEDLLNPWFIAMLQ